jgi:hydrogenase maturation protein HypF
MHAPAPLLVLGVGNPSRGDDALGPQFIDRLGHALATEVSSGAVELLTDFQLQIEHAVDLEGRSRVVFVDASVSAAPPFEFGRVAPEADTSCATHALSPAAVLATHRHVGGEPPEAWVLAIRGERFELGDPLTQRAQAHLDAALSFFVSDARGRLLDSEGRRLDLEGTVQGVGFRPWVYRTASKLGLGGQVYNTPAGVSIEAFGSVHALDALVAAIQRAAPPAARVRALASTKLPWQNMGEFRILASVSGGPNALTLPPDLATCEACLADVQNPESRYHGYAFTSCMECGPRFAIADSLPYDRSATTMAGFELCDACRAAYEAPNDRRFHAEAVACARCGPRTWLANGTGEEIPADDPFSLAADLLNQGKILGVQGLGAFHLVCDARDAQAVLRLRKRKRREAQPFAVMVRDLAEAEAIAVLSAPLRAALTHVAHPIVLAPAAAGVLPEAVNGPSRRTGVMLPYTPLHQLLLERFRGPLVVTSGNPSGGPAIIEQAEATERLGGIVDAFLFHDRPIARRVEDSVVAEAPGGTRVVRRARGLAPVPVQLPGTSPEPVLAVGGHMKNTACLIVGDQAYLTPHLGDLQFEESEQAWRRDVESFERLLGVHAEVVAHDLHPEYASTRFALARPARRHVAVQHHVAHVLSAVAELGLSEPVIGVVFDGSGFGTDGTSWGAEILLVDGQRWTRAHSFRALPLAGGEHALRQVWRVALGALSEAVGCDEALELASRLRVFDRVPRASLASVLRMIESGVGTLRARGIGRWFDAMGALALALPDAAFEAHVAIALEETAVTGDVPGYPVTLPSAMALAEPLGPEHEVDLRPTILAVVDDLLAGVAPGRVAARFQETIVDATARVVTSVSDATGITRVVLSGGSFQNRTLEAGMRHRLGNRVSMAKDIPINDGGIALGQAWAAALTLGAEVG